MLLNKIKLDQLLFFMAHSSNARITTRSLMKRMSFAPPMRLRGVRGHEGRSNDVVYCRPSRRDVLETVVVFFPGDVQDFSEAMLRNRESDGFVRWNLEDTALKVQRKFPSAHVVTIRPSRVERKTISSFNNFVPSNVGVPEHVPMHFALRHLHMILQGASKRIRDMTEAEIVTATEQYVNYESTLEVAKGEKETWWKDTLHLEECPTSIIGFSKGCVVLNQFLFEFHALDVETSDRDPLEEKTLSKITDMYWLDGGHAGGKTTWITDKAILETFSKTGIRVHVHVTPYQVKDQRRPWIGKEQRIFCDTLQKHKAEIYSKIHFEDLPPSLNLHFEVINRFRDEVFDTTKPGE